MTLKQIDYFHSVCAKGNISAAAEEMFVSRSVISRSLMELEEEFGTQIFVRSKNGVVLTESGRILACLFQEFSACYSATKSRLRQLEGEGERPTLRLGVTPTNAHSLYLRYFDAFRQAAPEVRICVEEHNANDAWQLLLNGVVDAFFTPARLLDRNMFDMLDLYKVQIVLGVPAQCSLANQKALGISDILDLPLGYLNAPMPVEEILNSCFRGFGKKPNVVLQTSDQTLLQTLTQRGLIYTVLPSDMLDSWPNVIGVPLNFFQSSTHHLVWSRAFPHNAAFDAFLHFMKMQVSSHIS